MHIVNLLFAFNTFSVFHLFVYIYRINLHCIHIQFIKIGLSLKLICVQLAHGLQFIRGQWYVKFSAYRNGLNQWHIPLIWFKIYPASCNIGNYRQWSLFCVSLKMIVLSLKPWLDASGQWEVEMLHCRCNFSDLIRLEWPLSLTGCKWPWLWCTAGCKCVNNCRHINEQTGGRMLPGGRGWLAGGRSSQAKIKWPEAWPR